MKRVIILFICLGFAVTGFSQEARYFRTIFNGKDLSGWVMPGEAPGFDVEDGLMVAVPHNSSDIFTKEFYGNFVLRFEYLLSEVGNSGVLIRCDPENPWRTGVEIQLLAPWTPYRDDLHCTGSIYGQVAVSNRPDETTGIWHNMEIVCDRKMVTISVDGKVTTTADIDTVRGMRNKHLQGAIGFQSNHSKEGEFAHFRNISVYDMDTDPGYILAGFYDTDARVRKQAWAAAEKLGPQMISHLAAALSGSDSKADAGAKQVLFNMVAGVTAPGSSQQKKQQVIAGLDKAMKENPSAETSGYLGWLLKMAKTDG